MAGAPAELTARPLSADRFAAFGQVIDLNHPQGAARMRINHGLTVRFHDLFTIDTLDAGGRPLASVFRTRPLKLPHRVQVMERHPLGSQAFIPLHDQPFLVLVAAETPPGAPLTAAHLRLFITDGRQGVNLYKNTWHHFQIALGERRDFLDFLVIDRGGGGGNLEETQVEGEIWIAAANAAE